ncbi:myrosinase 1-like isoform X1 [Schistocerca cancellata]|uniref:myrosinase 1-like isoform X1 n=2 Tax=Schistocerca cancellata TaxID=274614 RepID=UPI0021185989|nr:myrosinase 1-like isoform X1 [Schistocerca cancellata]
MCFSCRMNSGLWYWKRATCSDVILVMAFVLVMPFPESAAEAATDSSNQFPENFYLGFATSAYQTEGAWNTDGKGENIWDRLLHTQPNFTTDGSNADITDDSYHKYPEDIDIVSDMGSTMYRISIAWSRILPTGYANQINQEGIDHYNKVIDSMLAKNIEPFVTLYHFDLPQPLQDLGGWTNPEVVVPNFVDFARVAFEQFGDRVKYWVTFNEPNTFATGYASTGSQAPSINASGIGDYLVSYSVIKAHAEVWHMYDKEFRPQQNGQVGLALNCEWQQAKTNSTEDVEAAERTLQFKIGLWLHAIYSEEGDYPRVVRERVDRNSKLEGRKRSRLPRFTPEEIRYFRHASDFLGITHYSSHQITNGTSGSIPSMQYDIGAVSGLLDGYPVVDSSPIKDQIVPWGLRRVLNWLTKSYSGFPIMIVENGCSDPGTLEDNQRISYIGCYMAEVLRAIHEDGVDVKSYLIWSIIDNFEWSAGYTAKYGLYQVNMSDPQRTRTPKASASFVNKIFQSQTVPLEYFSADTSDLNSICYTAVNGDTSSSRLKHNTAGAGVRVVQQRSRHHKKAGRQLQQRRRLQKQARAPHGNR